MRIAILGAGKIGEALLSGLLRSGRAPDDLCFAEQYAKRAAEITERYGVVGMSSVEAAQSADVVVIAVKPPDVGALASEIASALGPQAVVVSVAAGITTGFLEAHLPPGCRVVRVMPNTPMLVGEGMSAIAAGSHAGDDDLARAEELLGAVGKVVRLPEAQLDAVTALSGSGPAYVFLLAEAMIDAGVLIGLTRPVATELAVQTLVGSAVMLRDSGDSAAQLREAVTSPGGTTAAALRRLEERGLRAAFSDALEAARDRSRELAGEK
ncbi:MAG TPA: pyrroline-5-carboxylate reductase [Frankiaceae bacterium]|jgi:pyrroline-5-carboxylate reductase|nr:pyrroline-5-carboxylate reductase [Frankiaceae bacterium]